MAAPGYMHFTCSRFRNSIFEHGLSISQPGSLREESSLHFLRFGERSKKVLDVLCFVLYECDDVDLWYVNDTELSILPDPNQPHEYISSIDIPPDNLTFIPPAEWPKWPKWKDSCKELRNNHNKICNKIWSTLLAYLKLQHAHLSNVHLLHVQYD